MPFGLRAGQGYLSSSSWRRSAGADRDVDDLLAVRAAVIGLAVVADAAHQGDEVVARNAPDSACAQSVLMMATAMVIGTALT